VAFDLLYLDGRSTMALAYADRRDLLDALGLEGPAWRAPAYHRGEGGALLAATKELGIEGIVAKRLDGTYEPGRRSSGWVKIKNICEQDVVIGGWAPGEGRRSGHVGALVTGLYEDGRLAYAGKVGTGFTDRTLAILERELKPLSRDSSPFEGRAAPKGTIFVEPRLVARVELREWTKSGTMRAPSFKGLRDDIDPQDCTREGG
jgi:bifunctional non-homologous end joining protein LigD